MRLNLLIGALAVVGLASFSASAAFAQEQSACQSGGTMILQNIPSKRSEIMPSLHRQLSGIGRAAMNNGCNIRIICIRDPSRPDPVKYADDMCRAVREAIAFFESRRDVRRTVYEGYSVRKVDPGRALGANDVQITVF